MAFVFKGSNAVAGSFSATIALGSIALAAGDTLIVCLQGDGTPVFSVSDTSGGANVYTAAGPGQAGSGCTNRVFVLQSAVAGTVTLTAADSANHLNGAAYFWYSGLQNVAPQVVSTNFNGTGGSGADNIFTSNLTPASQPGLLFGFTSDQNSTRATAGTGFTNRPITAITANPPAAEDRRVTALTAVPVTFGTTANFESYPTWAIYIPEINSVAVVAGRRKDQGPKFGRRTRRNTKGDTAPFSPNITLGFTGVSATGAVGSVGVAANIHVIQTSPDFISNSSAGPDTTNFSANFTAGSSVIYTFVASPNGAATVTIGGVAATKVVSAGTNPRIYEQWLAVGMPSGRSDVVITYGSTNSIEGAGIEVKEGLVVDLTAIGTATSSTTQTASITGTTAASDEIFVAGYKNTSANNVGTVTQPVGWTPVFSQPDSSGHTGGLASWVIVAAPVTNPSASWTTTSAATTAFGFATYKLSTPGGSLTGDSGTGSAGTMGPQITLGLTGVAATTAVGSMFLTLGGVSGSGSPGTMGPQISVPVTGVTSATSIGSLGVSLTLAIAGVQATGSVGTVSDQEAGSLTGDTGTGSVGTMGPNITVALTGVLATTAVGSVSYSIPTSLTGTAATTAVGTLKPAEGLNASGVTTSGSPGTMGPQITVALTGVAAAGQVGSLGLSLNGVAGTGTPGSMGPQIAIALTGVGALGALGALGVQMARNLTGVSGASAVGTMAEGTAEGTTGVTSTGSPGSMGPNITVALSGVEGDANVGSLSPPNNGALSGNEGDGDPGTMSPKITIAITGAAATTHVGSMAGASTITLGLTGDNAFGLTGDVVASGASATTLSGDAAGGSTGQMGPESAVALSGVAQSGIPGLLGPNITIAIGGNAANGVAGTVIAPGDVTIAIGGVKATGSVGTLTPVNAGDDLTGPKYGRNKNVTLKLHREERKKEQNDPLDPPARPKTPDFSVAKAPGALATAIADIRKHLPDPPNPPARATPTPHVAPRSTATRAAPTPHVAPVAVEVVNPFIAAAAALVRVAEEVAHNEAQAQRKIGRLKRELDDMSLQLVDAYDDIKRLEALQADAVQRRIEAKANAAALDEARAKVRKAENARKVAEIALRLLTRS